MGVTSYLKRKSGGSHTPTVPEKLRAVTQCVTRTVRGETRDHVLELKRAIERLVLVIIMNMQHTLE